RAERVVERVPWGKDFDHGVAAIRAHEGRNVVVLASGDPMHFGVGATLSRRFGIEAVEIIPAPGAFSLAAARLGWSLPDVACLTVHGRTLETVNRHLRPGARLLILSWDGTTPAKLAALLTAKGYGASRLSVLERMGGDAENRIDGTAADWTQAETAALNTIGVELAAGPDAAVWSRAAGLPEDAFRHDNMITKREVRAVTLAALAPLPGELLWDVGAGNGSVAVEWLRLEPVARAVAIEKTPARAANARFNALELGVPGLEVVEAEAPAAFAGLADDPDAIFCGGGLSEALLDACWARLRAGGRLVANAVTLEGRAALMAARGAHGGELVQIAVSREGPVGPRAALKPLMEVWQWRTVKP
ncbi:MAG: precorrin-6y C5,15-methyltransferase (decarboxylating) subunit CbiE, partial [Rhodospirillaceae bacterium]